MNPIKKQLWNRLWLVFALALPMSKTVAQTNTSTDQQQLVVANSGFGFRLLKELAREERHANLFISPYSISSVLQMLSTGARGQTLEELRKVLGIERMSPTRIDLAYQSLAHSISDQTNVLLDLANALWYRTRAQLNSDFVEANEKFYQATLSALDFSDPHSAQVMNDWAAEHTKGKIKTIIEPPISADTAMIIANAIYFKGTWLDPFDPKQTRRRPFHAANGKEEPVPMMQQTRTFAYQEGPGFQAVQLAYAGKGLEMEVLLPATNSSLEELVARMDSQFWQGTVLPAFQETRGTLVMPRFSLRYGAELKGSLMALGLKSAWNGNADFSGMSPSRLFLSEVKHQSFVEVNEKGTEAAAVTTGVVALAAFRDQPPPFQMIVDRPFLFLISDKGTGSILFIGAVHDPGGAGP
jgi:serpin B